MLEVPEAVPGRPETEPGFAGTWASSRRLRPGQRCLCAFARSPELGFLLDGGRRGGTWRIEQKECFHSSPAFRVSRGNFPLWAGKCVFLTLDKSVR